MEISCRRLPQFSNLLQYIGIILMEISCRRLPKFSNLLYWYNFDENILSLVTKI